jgi:hypothetical protein
MSTFIVDDIIRTCHYDNGIFRNVIEIGQIINLTNSNVIIHWRPFFLVVNEPTVIPDAEWKTTIDIIELSTFKLYGLDVQKKIDDNDWVDKNGIHYTNDSIYITMSIETMREERNKKLVETDKYQFIYDWVHPSEEIKKSWFTYRQSLRDLPTNSTLSHDVAGHLINVTWPTPPS